MVVDLPNYFDSDRTMKFFLGDQPLEFSFFLPQFKVFLCSTDRLTFGPVVIFQTVKQTLVAVRNDTIKLHQPMKLAESIVKSWCHIEEYGLTDGSRNMESLALNGCSSPQMSDYHQYSCMSQRLCTIMNRH
jgi:hypothetical protein